jgi:hypothetical protein
MPTPVNTLEKRIQAARNRRSRHVERTIFNWYRQAKNEIYDVVAKFYRRYNLPILKDGVADPEGTKKVLNKMVKLPDGTKMTRIQLLKNTIAEIMRPVLLKVDNFTIKQTKSSFKDGYAYNAWKMDQTSGIELDWSFLNGV